MLVDKFLGNIGGGLYAYDTNLKKYVLVGVTTYFHKCDGELFNIPR